MERPLPRIQDPVGEHTHTVIFLHGGGSDGPQFWRAINRSRPSLFSSFPSFRWVFPSAGLQWCRAQEIERSQWFDANPRDSSGSLDCVDIPGLDASVRYVLELVDEEVQRLGGRADRLVLGGLSQGQATSLSALLCCKHRLGAYVGMSGWLPLAHKLEGMDLYEVSKYLHKEFSLPPSSAEKGEAEQSGGATPAFLGHGTYDRKVPLELARRARSVLEGTNMDVAWQQYVGAKLDGHWIKLPEELDDVIEFLREKLQVGDSTSDDGIVGQLENHANISNY